jgi:hypothetical protein
MTYTDAVNFSFIYDYPLWVLTLSLLALLLGAQEIGYRIGLFQRSVVGPTDLEGGGGNLVLTSMLALLGLVMAFTYSAAVDRHEDRRSAIINEANALGTAYLRVDAVAEPTRSQLKQVLYDYAVTRAPSDSKISDQRRLELVETSLKVQQKIWPLVLRVVDGNQRGPVEAGLLSAITELLDMNTVRLSAITNKLPAPAVYMLVFIAAASMAVAGYNAGANGSISRWRMALFAVVLAGLMLLIIDFDRPLEGMVRSDFVSLNATIAAMKDDLAR